MIRLRFDPLKVGLIPITKTRGQEVSFSEELNGKGSLSYAPNGGTDAPRTGMVISRGGAEISENKPPRLAALRGFVGVMFGPTANPKRGGEQRMWEKNRTFSEEFQARDYKCDKSRAGIFSPLVTDKINPWLEDKTIREVIVGPGRLVNRAVSMDSAFIGKLSKL